MDFSFHVSLVLVIVLAVTIFNPASYLVDSGAKPGGKAAGASMAWTGTSFSLTK